jgi:hypothetical protein
MKTCVALFVESDGCYQNLDHVDAWDKNRDARNFIPSNLPIIAHPPCQLWGALAHVNYKRWGGDHNKPGNDDGLFKFALESVFISGGVLEHPITSQAFKHYGISKPTNPGWNFRSNYWICEVWQSAYGHLANKATCLLYVGKVPPFQLDWSRPKGSHQVGMPSSKSNNKPSLNKKQANATPCLFRDMLINLAIHSKGCPLESKCKSQLTA